jgi:hypothetical protein
VADEEEKAPDAAGEAPEGVRTTSATPPPLESDPFAITGLDDPPPKPIGAISSGAFEISRASFSQVPSEDLPPSTVISNAMGRTKPGLSLGAIAGIGIGVVVVASLLALLLFR